MTSLTSILHRATGAFLGLGSLAFTWWLWTAAYDRSAFDAVRECFSGMTGRLLLLAWTLAFYYHFCNGIRHLAWDAGYGYDVATAAKTGWIAILASVVLTAATWLAVWQQGPAPDDISALLTPVYHSATR